MSEKSLAARVQKMTESATIAMSQKSRALQEKGLDVISLSIGQPDFNTPDIIKEAAKSAIDENYSKYTPVGGYLELRKAICEKLKRENNLLHKPSEITVSTGAKQVIMNVILSLINEGDEVILPAPYWVSYFEQIKFAGGIPVCISSSVEDDFKINADQLKKAITEKTKLVIYSSPCNPSGSVYTKKELEQFANVISEQEGVFILADEIYEYINFTYEKTSMASFAQVADRTITVNGVAKGFAMTGWRIGYAAGPEWLINACNKIQGQFTSGANSIAQRATITALKHGSSITGVMKAAFLRRRNLMVNLLKEVPGILVNEPKGAFYVFPDVSSFFGKKHLATVIDNADDLCLFLLQKALVACVSGAAFGSPECIRISYASDDQTLIEAVKRIQLALSELK